MDDAVVSTYCPSRAPYLILHSTQQQITLTCLLGGVPAASVLMILMFCMYLGKLKVEIRQYAIANGVELGWPVHHFSI